MENDQIDDLNFEVALKIFRPHFSGGTNLDNDAYFLSEAHDYFALMITDKLKDEFSLATPVGQHLLVQEAENYWRYGACRRLIAIWHAFRELTSVVPAVRHEPLSEDESVVVARNLNAIYVDLRGTLDNYAFSLLHSVIPNEVADLNKSEIGLFEKVMRRNAAFEALSCDLSNSKAWYSELKSKRDPVAHRIPLYVPTVITDSKDAERYESLAREHWAAILDLDFESAEAAFAELESIGRVAPVFIHHPEEPYIPIHPTVSMDIAELIRIGRIVRKFLSDYCKPKER